MPPPTTCTPKYNQKLLPTASPYAVVVVVHCQVQNVFKPVAINDTPPPTTFTCHSLSPGHVEGCLCWHLLRLSRAWVNAWERVCVWWCVCTLKFMQMLRCVPMYVWAGACVCLCKCVKWTDPFCPGEKQCKLRTERLNLYRPPAAPLPHSSTQRCTVLVPKYLN